MRQELISKEFGLRVVEVDKTNWSSLGLFPLGLHKDQCGERISDSNSKVKIGDTLNKNLKLHSSGYMVVLMCG